MKEKVMQINITCGVGSTGRIAVMLYDACASNGYDTCFIYSVFKPVSADAFSIETKLQNYIRRGLNKYAGRKQKHATPGTKRLIRYIEREKPDLIHLHNIHLNCLNYILLLKYLEKKQIPIVYTLHDCWSFTGGCYYFSKRLCDQYKNGCHDCPIKAETDDITIGMEQSYRIKQNLIGNNPNIHIVCVSNWLKNAALDSYMHNMEDIRTIYNGIDTNIFKPTASGIRQKLQLNEKQFIILGVASYWDERKGLDNFKKLRTKLSDDYKIILVGLSEEQIADVGSEIFGIKRTENLDQLVELYSCADVYINTSTEETFGLTTAEAMACGTPAIVYNSTACPELLDEKSGIVLKNDDIELLVKAIYTIKEKGKANYSQDCIKRIKSNFCKEIMIDNYIKLYRGILNDK